MTTNHLGQSTSAYLRSAAHQPIHWYPWSDEAFSAATAQDKPILLDIGAVWCHWCHVMDGESYENPELAGLLNREDSNIVKNGFAQRVICGVCLVDQLGQHDIHIITRPD